MLSQSIQRTLHSIGAPLEHMGVDHGGADIGVAEQFLYGADVVACLEQVRGETMAKRVAANFLGDAWASMTATLTRF